MASLRDEIVPDGGRMVACVHCRTGMRVGLKAETATCPACYKRQTVRDVIVENDRTGARVETTGILFVKRKGRVWAPGVRAGDAVEVLGELKADVVTHGHVVIGETARWRGDCTAKILIVEDGARIDGGFFCIDPRGELRQEEAARSLAATEVKAPESAGDPPAPIPFSEIAGSPTPPAPPAWVGEAI
ncbi:MAG: polymer-forming cytoskeletal protein [Phycisphaerales bacterium]|nr:polymer-forming cytoskeletal protein [Planctomycetota bacterium]